jgi:hypothetical protein
MRLLSVCCPAELIGFYVHISCHRAFSQPPNRDAISLLLLYLAAFTFKPTTSRFTLSQRREEEEKEAGVPKVKTKIHCQI